LSHSFSIAEIAHFRSSFDLANELCQDVALLTVRRTKENRKSRDTFTIPECGRNQQAVSALH